MVEIIFWPDARPRRIGAVKSRGSLMPKYRGSIRFESSNALILDDKAVIELLKAAIEREGSIIAFAERHHLNRTNLTNILNGKRPVSRPLVTALGLRWVYTPEKVNG